ncbi:type I 3-dehydroquinate dehydratase [Vagococcus jeotgali]|uniref:type I 3-dehydroquinate dehydratase n=1 Tax=Vagococcus jeotgali TaxID=3109030 RepID=UPI002DD90AF8|nr:type I 3-dehydroquinate dehydratase [Vagococcus sp. B2T-5]
MSRLKLRNLTLGENEPKVCVSLIARNFEELFAEAMRLNALDCDMIEWRADYFMYVNDPHFMKKAAYFIRYAIEEKPLIFTFRTLQEGGGQSIDLDYYFELNKVMMETGLVDIVDLEFEMLLKKESDVQDFAKLHDVKVLMSNHDGGKTPSNQEMLETIYEMREFGADICKLAVMPHDMSDVLRILDVSNHIQTTKPDLTFTLIGMGDIGRLTRLTGELFGSSITYASNGKHMSAPGQLPIGPLRKGMDVIGLSKPRGR